MDDKGYTQDEFDEAEGYFFEDHEWYCYPGPEVTEETFSVDMERAVRASGLPEAALRAALTVAVKEASTIDSLDTRQGLFFTEDMTTIEIEDRPGPYHARVPIEFKEIVRQYMKDQKAQKQRA